MKFKQFIPMIFGCIFLQCTCFSQDMRPLLRGYEGRDDLYFDSLNKLLRGTIGETGQRFDVYVSFKVDTAGNVLDFEITEVPVSPLPIEVRRYIESLIKSTNGKWYYNRTNSKERMAMEIIYFILLDKIGKTIRQVGDENEKFAAYYFGPGDVLEISRKFSRSKHNKLITLRY